MRAEELFKLGGLDSYETGTKNALLTEINKLDDKTILNADPNELGGTLAQKFQIKPMILKDDKKYIGTPKYAQGEARSYSFELVIPYEGNPNLLRYQPRQFIKPEQPIYAEVISDVIILNYSQPDHDSKALKDAIGKHIELIKNNLELSNAQIQQFNESLLNEARSTVASRKANLQKRQNLINDLGIPFRE